MTNKEKMLAGEMYDANNDAELIKERARCKELCQKYNATFASDKEGRDRVIREIISSAGENLTIEQNFFCDYGYNICIGRNFFANHGLVILDVARVEIGDNVFIGPHCGIYTASHPLDFKTRNKGLETARPVTICDNVWIAGGVHILPGVTIGSGSVIGAGSVVTKDIPENVIAAGNPCRVIRNAYDDT